MEKLICANFGQNFFICNLYTFTNTLSKFECLALSRRLDITFESIQNPLPNIAEVW